MSCLDWSAFIFLVGGGRVAEGEEGKKEKGGGEGEAAKEGEKEQKEEVREKGKGQVTRREVLGSRSQLKGSLTTKSINFCIGPSLSEIHEF